MRKEKKILNPEWQPVYREYQKLAEELVDKIRSEYSEQEIIFRFFVNEDIDKYPAVKNLFTEYCQKEIELNSINVWI